MALNSKPSILKKNPLEGGFFVHASGKSLTSMRPVNATIVVVVVLAVVFLRSHMTTLYILGMPQTPTLLTRHDTIRLGTSLHVFDPLLTTLKTSRLAGRQAAGSGTLLNTSFLTSLALVDARRSGLCPGGDRQQGAENSNTFEIFHDWLLQKIGRFP